MQQLGKRNTYTPLGASQAHRSVTMSLNREETLSEHGSKTFSNNLDVNQQSSKTERNLRVFVINLRQQSLMPCSSSRARILLKQKKAKVVSSQPFTIQLMSPTGETKQDLTLGIDAGSKYIGFSVVDNNKELLSGEFELRQDVSKKISDRAMYRRNKRNKLWHRKPRFMNRSKPKGWLAPSIQHKVDTHIRLVEEIKSLLPIHKTIIEVAKFDTQKLQDVDIEGAEYQQGKMEGWDNLRAFILCRDNYTCQICKKQKGIFDIHHIIQRKDNGSNRPDNLVCVHTDCHKKFHAGKIKHTFKKPKQFKETVIMNNIKKYVVDKLDCAYTYGYITKRHRLNLELEKTHYNDAFVIAGAVNQERTSILKSKQIRRNNRCLQLNRNGFKPSIRKQRYPIQPKSIVKWNNKNYVVNGTHNKGKSVVLYVGDKKKSVSVNHLEMVNYSRGILC